VIKIIAVLCSLSSPVNCREQIVTTSDFADVSMQSCLMGAPQLAEWMKQHPAERLAALRDRQTGWQGGLGWNAARLKQDRRFPLNGSRMIKIDSGVRSILLSMPLLGARLS
jgi:hypothetical protein